jgi:ribonuclease E
MKQLMPTHAKKVQRYSDAVPLFQRFGVEGQLAAMFNPVVQLKSGGYLVINPTEALVAIDINSGRSTREHNIEDTALRTNLEAADEIARQLRLRDMAGLVVIDFIDMEVNGNVRKVEKAMKEALKNDRARIQIGRISSFGLMEMSRQRLRTGILEASSHTCPMCDGAGSVRTPSSAALGALRGLEEEALRGKNSVFRLRAANEVAVYILNRKRGEVADLEARYGITIEIFPDISLMSPRVEIDASGGPSAKALPSLNPLPVPEKVEDDADTEETLDAGEDDGDETPRARDGARDGDRDDGRRKRRRRRRGGRGDRDDAPAAEGGEAAEAGEGDDTAAQDREDGGADDKARGDRKRRRRGRRGGRGRSAGDAPETPVEAEAETAPEPEAAPAVVEDAAAKPARKSRAKKPKADAEAAAEVVTEAVAEPVEAPVVEEAPKKPARKPRAKKAAAQDAAPAETVAAPEAANDPEAEPQPRRKGWWQRTFGE